jgi:GNAT superfamily N-acetyltransferase
VPEPTVIDLGQYEISTDNSRLDLDRVEALLRDSYWAADRRSDVIERSIAGSFCFGAYRKLDGLQVGLARVVTDYATFGWVADVVVDPEHRGAGLGKALMQAIVSSPELEAVRLLLATRDAHGLYAQYGFEVLPSPGNWMQRPG